MTVLTKYLNFIFVLLALSACSTTTTTNLIKIVPLNQTLFNTDDIEVIAPEDIFALSEPQKMEFIENYNKRLSNGVLPHDAIYEYIQGRLSNFTYYGETYVAEKAMRLHKGNCMSLAILTTALAKLANVEFDYREVSTIPVFEKQNNLLLSSSHVQTLLYDPTFEQEENTVYFSRPSILIDYFPDDNNHAGRIFSIASFLGMYYKNIASDALVDNDLDKAFAYANKAYEIDPDSAETVNLLAVLHRRKGDLSTAEAIYKAGLSRGHNNLALLSNYIVLLKSQQRMQEAEALSLQLDNLDDPNPYSWLEQAYLAQDKKDYAKAKHFFNKVLDRAPYVSQAYQGLYQIYLEEDKPYLAKRMLQQALEWTYEIEERKLYKYKLYSLNN
ncbi:tetratricopeptide repeat protein [Colwelliaceae bacterium 6471]